MEFTAAAGSKIAWRCADCRATAVSWSPETKVTLPSGQILLRGAGVGVGVGISFFLSLYGNILSNSFQRKLTKELFTYHLYQNSQSCCALESMVEVFFVCLFGFFLGKEAQVIPLEFLIQQAFL